MRYKVKRIDGWDFSGRRPKMRKKWHVIDTARYAHEGGVAIETYPREREARQRAAVLNGHTRRGGLTAMAGRHH